MQVVKPKNMFENPLGKTEGIFYFRKFVVFFFLLFSLKLFSQPKMLITEAKKDFGSVKRGSIIKNEFEITNAGNAPLVISDVEIACSCTTVDFPKQPVLPGQKTSIRVIFNTTTVYGRQDRVVYVNSNDPKGPYKLRYKGNVKSK